MVDGWRRAGVDLSPITVIRPSGRPVEGCHVVRDYPDGEADFVMLGVKPQKLDEILPGLLPHIGPSTLIVSILAGTSAASHRDRFPTAKAIIRAMPNLPVAQGKGVTALYSDDAAPEDRARVGGLMEKLGLAPLCEEEEQLSAIGAVAGSGPAYVARFADALANGGAGLGLPADLARDIAVQTLIGTAAFAEESGVTMEELARRVASPKGTTEKGLEILDGEEGLSALVSRMLDAWMRRSAEMAAEAQKARD